MVPGASNGDTEANVKMSSNIAETRRELAALGQEIRKTQRDMFVYKNTISDILRLSRQMGLPPEIDQQVVAIQRLITLLNATIAAYRAVQIARMAAGDPVAWIQAGIEVAGVGMSVATMIESDMRGR